MAVTPYIAQAYSSSSGCLNTIDVNTATVCSPRSQIPDLPAASTLSQCVVVPGDDYMGQACPRNTSSVGYRPIPQTNPIPILPLLFSTLYMGYTMTPLQLPFDFHFYGETYRRMYISLNGALYFNQPYLSNWQAAPSFGMTGSENSWPAIGAFSAALSAQTFAGVPNNANLTYSIEGVYPTRQAVIRFANMKYYNFRGSFDMSVSFDIILNEGVNSPVEIRYYDVSPNGAIGSYLTIGMHGNAEISQYTSYVSYSPITPNLAYQLQGSTLTFTYTGVSSDRVCFAFGVNFTNAMPAQDLTYNDTNFNYYINPCAVLTTNPCSSWPSASICQRGNDGSTNALAVYNPNNIQWSLLPSSLGARATMLSGSYCSVRQQQREVHIDWICASDQTSRLVSVNDTLACEYVITIETSLACNIRPSELSSSSSTGSQSISSNPISTSFSSSARSNTGFSTGSQLTSSFSTGSSTIDRSSSTSSSHTGNTDASVSTSSSGLSDGAIAGIVVGVVVGVLLLCFIVAMFLYCRSRVNKAPLQRLDNGRDNSTVSQSTVEMHDV